MVVCGFDLMIRHVPVQRLRIGQMRYSVMHTRAANLLSVFRRDIQRVGAMQCVDGQLQPPTRTSYMTAPLFWTMMHKVNMLGSWLLLMNVASPDSKLLSIVLWLLLLQ